MENTYSKPVLLESVAAGAIGGLVAALAMNQFQAAISAVGESLSRIDQ